MAKSKKKQPTAAARKRAAVDFSLWQQSREEHDIVIQCLSRIGHLLDDLSKRQFNLRGPDRTEAVVGAMLTTLKLAAEELSNLEKKAHGLFLARAARP